MKITYMITMLREEKESQPAKYHKGYDKDIQKLTKIQDKIAATEKALEALQIEADNYWDNIGK